MVRKFSALMAALALGTGVSYADQEGKVDERPSKERGTLEQGDTTEPTAKPSEQKNDTANQNNDSTNKNDATDNNPRDTSNPGTQATAIPAKVALDLPELFARLHTINLYEI